MRSPWLVLVLVIVLAGGCTPRRGSGSDDDDSSMGDDDDIAAGEDGDYLGTTSGTFAADSIGTQVCTGSIEATVDGGDVGGALSCDFSLSCAGSWEPVAVPGTADLQLTGCIGDAAPLSLLWSDGSLLGLAEADVQSESLGDVAVRISFTAFAAEE
ncbi:MAG: hypothetical protein KDA24_21200 [Deltaproteobacteria bacterium]|nr:hypothetical protein [Deltaproteobacteria bacterium]